MGIKYISVNDIPKGVSRPRIYGHVNDDLETFVRSPHVACEVDTSHYKKTRYCANSYGQTIRKRDFAVRVITRGDRVFLIKDKKEAE